MEFEFFFYGLALIFSMGGAMFFLQNLEPTLVDEETRKILDEAKNLAASDELEQFFLTNRAK